MKLMAKPQVVKFWKALHDSGSLKDTVSLFENKKGYGAQRTLERYAQADTAFKEGLLDEEVGARTQWKPKRIKKIRIWWESEFGTSNDYSFLSESHHGVSEEHEGKQQNDNPESEDSIVSNTVTPNKLTPEPDIGDKEKSTSTNSEPSSPVPTSGDKEAKDNVEPGDVDGGEKKLEICLAPPDNIDVVILNLWGVPKKAAGAMLVRWRDWHRKGRHDICAVFPLLKEYLSVKKIPFKQAEGMLDSMIVAVKHDMEPYHELVETATVFRPWESSENLKSAFDDLKKAHEPNPAIAAAKTKHLQEIGQLLVGFLKEMDTTLSKSMWYSKFDIENSNFIHQMGPSHSWEVSFDFWEYIHLREDYDRCEKRLIVVLAKSVPKGATDEFSSTAARLSVHAALRKPRPNYRNVRVNDTKWGIEVESEDKWIVIGIAEKLNLDSCQVAHIQLINRYKASEDIKELLVLRKRMLLTLKKVRSTVKDAIAKQTHLRGICTECPRIADRK
jgi:hypothetical protein